MQLSKCLYITYDNFINKNMEINRDPKTYRKYKARERERERERQVFRG